jgi:hypothetical protein
MAFLDEHIKKKSLLLKPKSKLLELKPGKKALRKEYRRNKLGKMKLKKKKSQEAKCQKWSNILAENNIKLGTYNAPQMNIYFNVEHEHFFLEHIDSMGCRTRLNNTYSVSFLKALVDAYKKAKRMNLMKNKRSIAPPPEDTSVTAR